MNLHLEDIGTAHLGYLYRDGGSFEDRSTPAATFVLTHQSWEPPTIRMFHTDGRRCNCLAVLRGLARELPWLSTVSWEHDRKRRTWVIRR